MTTQPIGCAIADLIGAVMLSEAHDWEAHRQSGNLSSSPAGSQLKSTLIMRQLIKLLAFATACMAYEMLVNGHKWQAIIN